MSDADRPTVAELLTDADAIARDTLDDVQPAQAAAMVRAWPSLVQAAATLWAVLPPVLSVEPDHPDPMPRLAHVQP